MIVPRPFLILGTSLVGLPAIGLLIQLPQLFIPIAACLLAMVALVVIDAVMGLKAMEGITVKLPEKCRWIQGRKSQLGITFTSTDHTARKIRLAPGFPPDLVTDSEEMVADLSGATTSIVQYPITAVRRGLFYIKSCNFEISSPLGFWDVRSSIASQTAIRSYPNLESERKQMAAIFLRAAQGGLKLTRQVGQGRDFEKLREYMPGDSFDRIHWKATARRRHPITKVFQVERTQEVYVILDSSRLSGRLVNAEQPLQGTHLDRYILSALVLGLAAEQNGDLFGLMTFADKVQSFVRARHGKDHYSACREALYRLEPTPVSPDYQELITTIRLRLRRRALLVFLTDLDDPVLGESFLQAIELISRQHFVLVQMLQPPGSRPLFADPAIKQPSDIYRHLAEHMAWQDLRQLSLQLKRHGVTFIQSNNEQFSARITSEYLQVKQRQLL